MNDYPATREQVVWAFLQIPFAHLTHTWGTGPDEFRHEWHVNAETYINGIMLTADFDYFMGYLIEVVDRTNGTLSYHAIVTFHGRREDGHQQHESIMYEPECGTFFDRTEAADRYTVSAWGLSVIHGMIENYVEREGL